MLPDFLFDILIILFVVLGLFGTITRKILKYCNLANCVIDIIRQIDRSKYQIDCNE